MATHKCFWPTCSATVSTTMFGCRRHWFRLPKRIRDKIWEGYRNSRSIWLEAAKEARRFAEENPEQ